MSLAGKLERATFAMGCFWGPDSFFGTVPGVIRTAVGYCGGIASNPTYYNLGDHTEAINIDYDPNATSYKKLLQLFWTKHEPTVVNKTQYISAIYYHDDNQKSSAEETKDARQKELNAPIVTKILPYKQFYDAEGYHQKYYLQTFHSALYKHVCPSEKDLITSTVAAKLNCYVTGNGSLETFNQECSSFGLTNDLADYVRNQIRNPDQGSCH